MHLAKQALEHSGIIKYIYGIIPFFYIPIYLFFLHNNYLLDITGLNPLELFRLCIDDNDGGGGD